MRTLLMNYLITILLVGVTSISFADDKPAAGEVLDKKLGSDEFGEGLKWYDIRALGVEGRGWEEAKTKHSYDRLPGAAEGVVRDPVWSLSHHSAGMVVRFVTDAPSISARWVLRSPGLDMPHMPATGVSGLDLYVRHEGKLRWLAIAQPTQQTNQVKIVSELPAGRREYWLYLPLYNGVDSVHLGIPAKSNLAKAAPWAAESAKPIVFYGTSITHGGCAARPGMTYPAILGRRFDRPTINLGFSGNGRMEQEVADLLAQLDPCVYVLDCLPNMSAAEVAERTGPVVETLRKAHPETPILLVEDRTYCNAFLLPRVMQRNIDSRKALRTSYDALLSAGVKNLGYCPGDTLLGADGEDTVDGSHPTDLGFLRMADALEKHLAPLLPAPAAGR